MNSPDAPKPDATPGANPAADADLDPFRLRSPETLANPYPVYARLREEAPVYFSAAYNGWLVTRYDHVAAGFRDPRLSAKRSSAFVTKLPDEVKQRLEPLRRNLASWALLLDPPEHTRIRSLINKAFVPRLVEGLRPRVEALVTELLDAAAPAGQMDVLRDLGDLLPLLVIGEMLGVPTEDRHRLKGWSNAIAGFLGSGRPTLEIATATLGAVVEMEDYFRGVIAVRRQSPGNDLLSQLLLAEEQGMILGEQELLSTCCMLLFGGHETTKNLIGNGLLALLQNPREREALRASPALLGPAVEELLRYDTPVQWMSRVALDDLEIEGVRIAKGDRVFLVLGAANRDPAHFPEPDRLDFRRTDIRHISFGLGVHYCAGAALARVEAQSAISLFLRRFPGAELSPAPVTFRQSPGVRGLVALPVVLGPERAVS
ncbi:cytochrome P450 [Sorangium cellulosum]|uniref:Cytochrome P450 n=1 Tax=Sorangium cellulosum TaxID=56 RepID=A0A4P2PU74_SORCE|nr:cytochrome P450 [Sorangium cellulosum]AUX20305.1 cytochrome P450 [Sorangium cellulosum]